MKAFFSSQFAYCPVTWIFHNKELNYNINRSHERCSCVVYLDDTYSFEDC